MDETDARTDRTLASMEAPTTDEMRADLMRLRHALATPASDEKPDPEGLRKSRVESIRGYAGEVPEQYRVPVTAEMLFLDAPPTENEKRMLAEAENGTPVSEIAEAETPGSKEALRAIKLDQVHNPRALSTEVDAKAALEYLRETNPPQEGLEGGFPGGILEDDLAMRLREITGAGMMDCKRALREAGGNLEKAQTLIYGKWRAARALGASSVAPPGTGDPDPDEAT